jgi:hypothetical protein
MLSIGSLCLSLRTPPKPLKPSKTPKPIRKLYATKAMAGSNPKKVSTFEFRDLMETFAVDVKRAENRPLNVPLIAPFTIASSRLDKVENVAIRIELSDGCVGWGEAPILPFVTAEDQSTAMIKAREACELLKNSSSMKLGLVLERVSEILPGHEFASVSRIQGFSCFFFWVFGI